MGRGLRVILFNMDEAAAVPLRSSLLGIEGIKIVAEIDEPVLLPQAVQQIPAEVLMVHLDPQPPVVLTTAGELARSHPELAVMAVSESTDGQLILSTMRMGFREFLARPLDAQELIDALERVATTQTNNSEPGRLITVTGSGGGVGATILAANLAVELSELADGQVAVVDLDYRFGHVATLLDLDPTYTIADLCETPEQLENQVIERALVQHATGVRALCRPEQFAQADNITAAHCVGVLSGLCGFHEYVVVDGPTRFDTGSKAVFDLADINLLVVQLLVPCVRNARRMLDGMRDAGCNLQHTYVVCNRVGRESGNLSFQDVEATLGVEIFHDLPEDWSTVSNAVNMGEPLATCAPKSRIRLALMELAQRLHEPPVEERDQEEHKKSRGLLSKIFSDA